MLIDDVKDLPHSQWDLAIDRTSSRRVRDAAMRARSYCFDDAASRKLGFFATSCADLMSMHLEFAIPPFDCTYIEVNINEVIRGTGQPDPQDISRADWKVGFLFDQGDIFILANSRSKLTAAVGPFGYMDTAASDYDLPSNYEARDADLLFLGSALKIVDQRYVQKFVDRFRTFYIGSPLLTRDAMLSVLQGSIGELRFFIAALLFIQSKRGVSIGGVPFERKIARGKSRVFMAHNVVTINLEGEHEMRRAFTISDRAPHRAHEVPSHFAHRYGDRACEHQWRPREEEPTHWDCPLCGRFRYLRKQHMRGDASKGFVTKEYSVIARKETR